MGYFGIRLCVAELECNVVQLGLAIIIIYTVINY